MQNVTKQWFDHLSMVQIEMKNLNHLTKDNLRDFSQQTIGELLLTDMIKENVRLFCLANHIGLVPDDGYDKPGISFATFLDNISYPIQTSILLLFYSIAVKYKPALLAEPVSKVRTMQFNEVFKEEPFSANPGKQELDKNLIQAIPSEFYSTVSSWKGTDTVDKLIKGILT